MMMIMLMMMIYSDYQKFEIVWYFLEYYWELYGKIACDFPHLYSELLLG